MQTDLLKGKRGLIMGLANDKSIAWGIAKACRDAGAELAFSYQGDALLKRVTPLAAEVGSDIVLPCDVGDMDSVDPGALEAAERAGVPVERHPVAKDATDLELALGRALADAPSRLVVVTGAGDRFDHALAVALGISAPGRPAVPTEAFVGPAHLWVVRGEVRLPGLYPILDDTGLDLVLAAAGGAADTADLSGIR